MSFRPLVCNILVAAFTENMDCSSKFIRFLPYPVMPGAFDLSAAGLASKPKGRHFPRRMPAGVEIARGLVLQAVVQYFPVVIISLLLAALGTLIPRQRHDRKIVIAYRRRRDVRRAARVPIILASIALDRIPRAASAAVVSKRRQNIVAL